MFDVTLVGDALKSGLALLHTDQKNIDGVVAFMYSASVNDFIFAFGKSAETAQYVKYSDHGKTWLSMPEFLAQNGK